MDVEVNVINGHSNTISTGNTVLWFEFLVDPSLLIPHLSQEKPEPSATELITKLLTVYHSNSNVNSIDTTTEQEFSLRGIALKILALQIAAFVKWDFKLFQSKLALPIQIKLLEDLVYITSGKILRMAKQVFVIDIQNCTNEVLFAYVLWHRWIVSSLVHRAIQQKIVKPQSVQLPSSLDNNINVQISEEFNRYIESTVNQSVAFLLDVLNSDRVPKILTPDTFIALTDTSTDVKQNWDTCIEISVDEFRCQIHYDLAIFYFYQKMWKLGKEHFIKCFQFHQKIQMENHKPFFKFNNLDELKGYLIAIGETYDGFQPSLLYKFCSSVRDGFAGTVSIMQIDNIERKLPLIHRQLTEIETMGALSCEKYYVAKDILIQFGTLNLIRRIIDGTTICPMKVISFLNSKGSKAIDFVINAIIAVLSYLSDADRQRIKYFFLIISPYMKQYFQKISTHSKLQVLFTEEDYKKIETFVDNKCIEYPHFQSENVNFSLPDDYHNVMFEQKLLQRSIIQCYDFKKLQNLIIEWHKKTQGKSLLRINPNWQLPIPLQSVVMSLEDSVFQSIAYVILAKGRELMLAKDYKNSLRMYSQVDTNSIRNSTNSATFKLWKLVSWELLLVKVIQYTDEWPANYLTTEEKQDLITKCKDCLQTQQTDFVANVIPRTELIEHFSLFLLNVGEWEFIINLEKRWNYFELTTAVAHACQDFVKHKGSKKLNKDVWELVLPVFGPSPTQQAKRGNSTPLHRESPNTKIKLNVLGFISSLRNDHALSLMIAMLARLYNILKDESSLELVVEHLSLWPAVISNANSYSSKSVSEMLWETLEIALKYYPNNASWLKLMGDMNFCNEYPEAALKCYIKSLIVSTEYFTQSIQKNLFDDHTIKRMIKCCSEINCYTQAVVLCQFLEQVDYTTAFQCLNEMKPGNCHDAMDAYYCCIWDTTILEYLIYLHHKRGEEHRKREAIKIIGQLELNSNNSEEIKREASEMRKRRFLRAMVKQYVIKYPI